MAIKYPKAVMSRTELEAMGSPRGLLEIAYADPKQDFAQKVDPTRKHSKIMFITEGFEAWRVKRQENERKARA